MRQISTLIVVALFAAWLAPDSALSGDRYHAGKETIAIDGFDPVAYFTMGEPVRGDAEFSHSWQGKTWHFSDKEHLAAFTKEPRRYAPRYGGFCAGAMARGWRAPVDPEAFVIIDGKLYLAYEKQGIAEFSDNAEEKVPSADTNWQRINSGG